MYHREVSQFFKVIKPTQKSKKAIKHTKKAYWTEQLSTLWLSFHEAEKLFVKAKKSDRGYENLKHDFFNKQRMLDKEL